MSSFKIADLGTFADLGAKVFLKDKLDLTSCELSLNRAQKGTKAPFRHKHHQNEEIYIFLKWTGKMAVDGEEFTVHEGTCVKVEPQGCRYLENTGDCDPDYIYFQARANSLQQSLSADGEIC